MNYVKTRAALRYAFRNMRTVGVRAFMTTPCCASCTDAFLANKKLPDGTPVAYFHRQDDATFRDKGKLHLRFGAWNGNDDATAKVGEKVVEVLRSAGLSPFWNGDPGETIKIHTDESIRSH